MLDNTRLADEVAATVDRPRGSHDGLSMLGRVEAVLRGPDGRIKARCVTHNLITSVGDQGYAGQVLSSGKPTIPTGMKLGTGSTAVAKTGAGAALVTYLSASNKLLDATYPTAAAGVVTWRRTYAAGEATTASAITEVALVTDAATDATSTAANTWSRAILAGIGSKGASDTLTITWTHTLLGA